MSQNRQQRKMAGSIIWRSGEKQSHWFLLWSWVNPTASWNIQSLGTLFGQKRQTPLVGHNFNIDHSPFVNYTSLLIKKEISWKRKIAIKIHLLHKIMNNKYQKKNSTLPQQSPRKSATKEHTQKTDKKTTLTEHLNKDHDSEKCATNVRSIVSPDLLMFSCRLWTLGHPLELRHTAPDPRLLLIPPTSRCGLPEHTNTKSCTVGGASFWRATLAHQWWNSVVRLVNRSALLHVVRHGHDDGFMMRTSPPFTWRATRLMRASPLSVLPCCGPNCKRLSPRSRTHDPQPPCTDHTHRDELGPVPNTCITPCSPGMFVWRKMAIPQDASERSWKQQPYQNGLRAQWVARFRSNDGKDAEQPTIQHNFHSCKTVQADARNLGSGITSKVSCEEHSDHYRYAHVHEWVVHPEHQRTRAVVKMYCTAERCGSVASGGLMSWEDPTVAVSKLFAQRRRGCRAANCTTRSTMKLWRLAAQEEPSFAVFKPWDWKIWVQHHRQNELQKATETPTSCARVCVDKCVVSSAGWTNATQTTLEPSQTCTPSWPAVNQTVVAFRRDLGHVTLNRQTLITLIVMNLDLCPILVKRPVHL